VVAHEWPRSWPPTAGATKPAGSRTGPAHPPQVLGAAILDVATHAPQPGAAPRGGGPGTSESGPAVAEARAVLDSAPLCGEPLDRRRRCPPVQLGPDNEPLGDETRGFTSLPSAHPAGALHRSTSPPAAGLQPLDPPERSLFTDFDPDAPPPLFAESRSDVAIIHALPNLGSPRARDRRGADGGAAGPPPRPLRSTPRSIGGDRRGPQAARAQVASTGWTG